MPASRVPAPAARHLQSGRAAARALAPVLHVGEGTLRKWWQRGLPPPERGETVDGYRERIAAWSQADQQQPAAPAAGASVGGAAPPPAPNNGEPQDILVRLHEPGLSALDKKRLLDVEIRKLDFLERRGQLVDREEVVHAWSLRMAYFASRAQRMGTKLQHLLGPTDDPAEIKRVIDEELAQMLSELADGKLGANDVGDAEGGAA